MLAGALGVVITAGAIRVSWGGSYWVFGAVVGALAIGGAVAGLRYPVFLLAGTAILVAASAGLPREPGPATVLALGVVVAAAAREAEVGVPAAGLAVVAAGFVAGGATTVPVLSATGWVGAVGVGLGLRAFDVQRRAAREAVRREERLELARELHDVVAHHVTGIVVQAQAAQLRSAPPGSVPGALAGIEAAGTEALAAMRRLVGVLRSPGDAGQAATAPEELDALLDRWRGPRLRRDVAAGEWPAEVRSTVYRVVQEALTNVSRHAPGAGSVTVSVAADERELVVDVTDDAPAVSSRRPRGGYGLIGMRERVESLGGVVTAGPRDAGGWSVRATIPL
ncbi:Histidine kinase,'ATPase, histidine kinase/DNA gyrase B/HSP90-like' [Cryptosporangium arvum DSM 44712]|uniref:histidine kinase n=1 Tax=Cryptosporangium arvum DSM 44712 TaxID=927661 RepID=A0A010Z338_9ACTN|nr:Histidine kinase,'ATPase, histidine kinase/DNA gyrase B/HSP90-like' [Cryptosporangium arvum DSM 44712]